MLLGAALQVAVPKDWANLVTAVISVLHEFLGVEIAEIDIWELGLRCRVCCKFRSRQATAQVPVKLEL